MRLPDRWPLTARVLMTNEEYEVFKWLAAVFDDHLVMVKLPVLRFTMPIHKNDQVNSERWQRLMNGVYCSFTVCTANGNVVGCVDVPGKRGIFKKNRQLKETLLLDCRIAYTIVRSSALPDFSAMRAAFLGEMPSNENLNAQRTRGGDSEFQADLDSFSKEKRQAAKDAALVALNSSEAAKAAAAGPSSGFHPTDTGGFVVGKPGGFRNPWDDSFFRSDDTRPIKLN